MGSLSHINRNSLNFKLRNLTFLLLRIKRHSSLITTLEDSVMIDSQSTVNDKGKCMLLTIIKRSTPVKESWNLLMGHGGGMPPIYSNLEESWSKVSHAARELATVFSVTFLFLATVVHQMVKSTPPPNGKYLGTLLEECEK